MSWTPSVGLVNHSSWCANHRRTVRYVDLDQPVLSLLSLSLCLSFMQHARTILYDVEVAGDVFEER